MGDTLRERLVALWKEFTEARGRFARLKMDLLMQLSGEPMTRKRWTAFLEAKGERASADATWDDFPDGQFLARFSGNLQGLPEFEGIAKNAYLLLCETDPTLNRKDGYYGWLRTIRDIARDCPTKAARCDVRLWGHKDPPGKDVFAKFTALRFTHKGMSLPSYPVQLSFGCLFNVSKAVLELFLAPYRAGFLMNDRPIRLVPWQLCAVSANYAMLGHTPTDIAQSGIRAAVMDIYCLADRLLEPRFIEGPDKSGWLLLGGIRLRKVDSKATFLRLILREFEHHGWPQSIDITGSKAQHQARTFHTQMNGNQKGLNQIEFKVSMNGKRISWRVVPAIVSPSQPDTSEQQDG